MLRPRMIHAGEFCVMAFGDVSVEDLFNAVKGRPLIAKGYASVRSKNSFYAFKIPNGYRVDLLLKNLRTGKIAPKFKYLLDMYMDPDGPALALVCGRKFRQTAFANISMANPRTVVIFTGTALIPK